MGNLEKSVRQDIRLTKINKLIIATIASVGILSVALLAPNALEALSKLGIIDVKKRKQNVQKSISRLIENGYVVIKNGKAHLSPKGEKFAALLGAGRLAPKKQKRWDRKWRVLIFDIPERRRRIRDSIRETLVFLGFVKLQNSVWVYPYDCEDIITIFKIDKHIGKDMLYLIVDKIENDKHLLHSFKLKE